MRRKAKVFQSAWLQQALPVASRGQGRSNAQRATATAQPAHKRGGIGWKFGQNTGRDEAAAKQAVQGEAHASHFAKSRFALSLGK
jgi:hypothetical protein